MEEQIGIVVLYILSAFESVHYIYVCVRVLFIWSMESEP